MENLSLTAECYHQFASTHMITQNSITSRSPTQKASLLNDSFEDLDTVPELSESSNGPSTPKDLSFAKTPGSAHTIGSNHDIYKLANTMANNNNNIRKKGIKHTLMRGFKNTTLHKKTTAYQTKKEQKRLLKGLNDVGQNNSNNNNDQISSRNNIPENEDILKYKQEISSKLGQVDIKRMEKRCYSSYNQINDRYLEVDRENQSFLRVPSYPWFSIRVKDNHFYQNVLATHYDFNRLFKASRYPVYKFCLPETGIFITSAKFQSEIFDLLEKKVARLKGSSINKNIQDQDTSNSSNNPSGAAIKTKLFSKQDKYKIYIEILERFYLQICDQKSKKILIVINKSHAAHKRREWNFTLSLKSGGSGRGLFIQGIKFYTCKSIDDIFQKFDRSLRPFPGEKFAKQKDLSNARIANQESYNYLQTNGYGNLEASSQVQQDFGSEGGISSEDLNSNNNYNNNHGNHKTAYTGMPHMRIQPIDHQDFNNNRTRISNNNRDYRNYRSYADQYLYSNLDPEYFQIINDILHDSHRLSKALEEFSIHLAIENEADYSAIISSLVNIFADQKMRTIDGLIEIVYREFILAGHRFKANHNRQNFILAPIFLVFLDCVHQLWVTNRSKFEFNQRFLETLAYHSYSRRFPDFMFDNEKERLINLKNLCRTDHHLNNFRNFLDINRDLYYNLYYQSSLSERNITKSFVGHISPNPINIDQYNQSKDPAINSSLLFYDSLKQSGHKLKIFSFWINTHLVSYDYYDIMLSLENTEDLVSEVQKQTANLNSSSKRNKNNILTSHSTDSHFATRKLNYGSEENSRNESYYNDLLVVKRHLLEKLELKKLELRKTQNLQLSSHEDQETLFSPTARRSFPHESNTKQNSKLLNLQKTPENLEIGLSNKKSANSAAKYINYENCIRNSVHEKINLLKVFSRKLSLSWHTTRWHNNKYLIEKNRGGTIFDSASQFSGNTRITSKQSYGYTITNSSIDY